MKTLSWSRARISGQPQHVARAVAIDASLAQEEREWIADLRARGVKAAHPDDGWVKRDTDRVHLEYPQFNDGLDVGALLALGRPGEYRIVRVVGVEANRFARMYPDAETWYWHFEA
jgi:hypothetical protein